MTQERIQQLEAQALVDEAQIRRLQQRIAVVEDQTRALMRRFSVVESRAQRQLNTLCDVVDSYQRAELHAESNIIDQCMDHIMESKRKII